VINNKGYVFTPMLLLFLVVISLTVVLFKQGLTGSVNEASQLQGVMDNVFYNYTKHSISSFNQFKLLVYGNMSNSSLVSDFNDSTGGYLNQNNPIVPLTLETRFYQKRDINISYPETAINVTFNYPLSDLLVVEDSFNPVVIQQCIDSNDCSSNRGSFDVIFSSCLEAIEINGFDVVNSSVPLLIGDTIYSGIAFLRNETTFLFPFDLGTFLFSC